MDDDIEVSEFHLGTETPMLSTYFHYDEENIAPAKKKELHSLSRRVILCRDQERTK